EPDGLVWGESEYYLAKKDYKWAIFHKDGRMITPDWFYYISLILFLVLEFLIFCSFVLTFSEFLIF
ncbi:MAG: hypothetical protein ACP5OZ_04695, partial [Candidatus Woesearchaeota archaeon]